MRTGSITLTIPSHADHVYLVGVSVNRICTECGLGELAAYEAEVAVVEAVNNAIEHAYGNEPTHQVEIVVSVEADRILFAIRDSGRALPAEALAAPLDEAADSSEHGRGLRLIRGFVDEVTYASDGSRNTMTLVKRLRPA